MEAPKSRESDQTSSNMVNFDSQEFAIERIEDPIVTIDRKIWVRSYLVCLAIFGCVILIGALAFFGGKPVGNVHRLMLCLLSMLLSAVCAAGYLWIRSRWIQIAVIDENGILATTVERSYDLLWGKVIGARTSMKYPKNSVVPKVHLLLLLDDDRCLESAIPAESRHALFQILQQATFRTDRPGQRLGNAKGIALFVFGALICMLGMWWVFVLKEQFDAGVLFRGNSKLVLLKIALGVIGPVGGLVASSWSMYHIVAKPILYEPGWHSSHSWFG